MAEGRIGNSAPRMAVLILAGRAALVAALVAEGRICNFLLHKVAPAYYWGPSLAQIAVRLHQNFCTPQDRNIFGILREFYSRRGRLVGALFVHPDFQLPDQVGIFDTHQDCLGNIFGILQMFCTLLDQLDPKAESSLLRPDLLVGAVPLFQNTLAFHLRFLLMA